MVLQSIRDSLADSGAPIHKAPGLRTSKALADYRNSVIEDYQRNIEEPPDKIHIEPLITHEFPCEAAVMSNDRERNSVEDVHLDNVPMNGESCHTLDNLSQNCSRPSDISKIFGRELRYSGGPKEPLRRRFDLFKDACDLSGVDTADTALMMKIIPTTFLSGQATIYFTDVIKQSAKSTNEAINMLEQNFLDQRAKRVNDEIWHDLPFDFI